MGKRRNSEKGSNHLTAGVITTCQYQHPGRVVLLQLLTKQFGAQTDLIASEIPRRIAAAGRGDLEQVAVAKIGGPRLPASGISYKAKRGGRRAKMRSVSGTVAARPVSFNPPLA